MPLDGSPMPRALAPAAPPAQRRRRAPFWRGAAGAVALAAWSVAGVIGAFLALLPISLAPGPRGRARAAQADGAIRRLGPAVPEVALEEPPPADPVPAARAAGDAFPG